MAQGGVGFALQNVNFINDGPGAQRLGDGVAALNDPVGLGLRALWEGGFDQTCWNLLLNSIDKKSIAQFGGGKEENILKEPLRKAAHPRLCSPAEKPKISGKFTPCSWESYRLFTAHSL